MEAPYKILSLDGGGSWAILQVLTLKAKYGNISGHQILREFDLVNALYQLDMDLMKDEDIQLIKQCFTAWESGHLLNQPIKASMTANDELLCVIGHSTFQQALAHW